MVGRFEAYAWDNGEKGADSMDFIEIYVYSGPYAGYYNSGYLGGGNIQFWPEEN